MKPPNAGKGRVKGTPNKATANAREAIAQFVEGNVSRLQGWLEAIAADDPKAAYQCFMDVIEYHIPKLARTEISGPEGKPLEVSVVSYSNPEQLGASRLPDASVAGTRTGMPPRGARLASPFGKR